MNEFALEVGVPNRRGPFFVSEGQAASTEVKPAFAADLEKFQSQDWAPTGLHPDEEVEFRKWLSRTQLFNSVKKDVALENNLELGQIDNDRLTEMMLSAGDYDYRGAYKAGITEQISPHDNRPHWPSATSDGRMLKSPNHPTTWKEFFMRHHRNDPDDMGLHSYEQAVQWAIKNGGVK